MHTHKLAYKFVCGQKHCDAVEPLEHGVSRARLLQRNDYGKRPAVVVQLEGVQ
jgi:hypothetical protein